MQWEEDGIVLAVRKFGEHAATIRLFTKEQGVYSGVARGAHSKAQRGIYQISNIVHARWNARLEEHMGSFTAELKMPVAALVMSDPLKLALATSLASLLEAILPERHPYPPLFAMTEHFLEMLAELNDEATLISEYVWLEKEVLSASGFGLDLEACAATGQREALVYVSPKSGRAVCRQAGAPYHEKMLPLPPFLLKNDGSLPISTQALLDGLALTRYFLGAWVFSPRGANLPSQRTNLERTVRNQLMKHGQAV